MAKLQDKFFNRVIEGDLLLDGPVKGDLELESSGKAKIFENIVDKDGHKRFVEGNGAPNHDITGFTASYCKWSLSGTHLMCVLAGTFEVGCEIGANANIVSFELPSWIANKIFPVWSDYFIQRIGLTLTSNAWGVQTLDGIIAKTGNLLIYNNTGTALTITSDDKHFRLSIDLLIDNE